MEEVGRSGRFLFNSSSMDDLGTQLPTYTLEEAEGDNQAFTEHAFGSLQTHEIAAIPIRP